MANSEQALSNPEDNEEVTLSELGDYVDRLTDYEERLARGAIHWQ